MWSMRPSTARSLWASRSKPASSSGAPPPRASLPRRFFAAACGEHAERCARGDLVVCRLPEVGRAAALGHDRPDLVTLDHLVDEQARGDLVEQVAVVGEKAVRAAI